jgi:hypothetical protein
LILHVVFAHKNTYNANQTGDDLMKFIDRSPVGGTRRTSDGYLVATALTARVGIQDYAGWEVGRPDMAVVKVYRPPEQVFDKASLGSYAHKPITNDHPTTPVTADNWKDVAVGSIGDEIARDGEFVRIPLIIMDAATIKAVEEGKRELSTGYVCELHWGDGITPDGEKYDATQMNIQANHVAVVKRGRAGMQARIGDDAKHWGASPVNLQTADEKESQMTEQLRKVLVDGLQVETTDAGATAINKLVADIAASTQRFADAEAAHAKALATKDAELAAKDAEVDALKAKVLSDADLDKRVADRADLIATAKSIAKDIKTDGLSDAEIRKAAVVASLGDAAIADKSDAYIDARFDILAEDAKKLADANPADPVVAALKARDAGTADAAETAYQKMVADMQSAHAPAVTN